MAGVGVVPVSVLDVPELLVVFFCCVCVNRCGWVKVGMGKKKSKSEQGKTVFSFGFDMEVFAVGVPNAYEPWRFSPFPNKKLCFLEHADEQRIKMLRRLIVLQDTVGVRNQYISFYSAGSDKIRRCTRRSGHVL